MKRLLAVLFLFITTPIWAAPTVSLSAPTNGNLYLAPGTFAVKANASAPGVGVSRVEFYANGSLIQTDTTSPYQFDWTGVAAGTYAISAKAIDNNGATTTSAARTVTVAATNTAPTVSLTAPTDNVRYLNPTSVTFSATASGPELNDIVQRVDFFLNGTLASSITQAPFTYGAMGLAVGTYTLTALATDSQGAQTTSAPRTFSVSDTNAAPTVALVIPMDNSRWNAPATVTFQASVNSGEANDTVSVEFFANSTSLGTRSSPPFSLSTSLAAATYTVTAVATDGQGAQTTSVARTIVVSDTNAAPTISLTAPASDANFPTAPASFTLNATAGAGEINGWVTRVEFYVNDVLVNTDTAGPFSFNVSGLANGTYTLTAKAVDQLNAETTSAPITVTVGAAPAKGYFIHTDHLNTPRLVADATGTTVWRWDQQEPFGVNVPDENPSGVGTFEFPMRFPGQYADRETNLFYNYHRHYDASTSRYVQSDPIGLQGGISTYSYVVARPLSLKDTRGLRVTLHDRAITDDQGNDMSNLYLLGGAHSWLELDPDDRAQVACVLQAYDINPPFPITLSAFNVAGMLTKAAGGGGRQFEGPPRRSTNLTPSQNKSGNCDKCGQISADSQFIVDLILRFNGYQDNLSYSAAPGAGASTYNSNGFAYGLLGASGYDGALPPMFGGDNPVPSKFFGPSR